MKLAYRLFGIRCACCNQPHTRVSAVSDGKRDWYQCPTSLRWIAIEVKNVTH